jgi:hypothetical protein
MPRAKRSSPGPQIRDGGTRFQIENSGLEVWLYDDSDRQSIIDSGGMNWRGHSAATHGFDKLTKAGRIVGYSLYQDDGIDIELHVGKPFTEKELSDSRWLEPQTAWLRLPTGDLAVESNDTCRLLEDYSGAKGGRMKVPPGDYRLTLYRADHEALDREELTWKGPQELVVLTPGGTAKDAVADLLPFVHRRDLSWVGKYEVKKGKATGLAWFNDYWDTFFLNLDKKAVAKLGLSPGTYFRTKVPDAGLELITVFAESWEAGRNLPLPDGVDVSESGYGAISTPSDWPGTEAIFCRREKSKTRCEDPHQNLWLPMTVEVLDLKPRKPVEVAKGMNAGNLRECEYFDSGFLSLILSDVVPGADDEDEFPLPAAVDRLDEMLGELGFQIIGDITWPQSLRGETYQRTARLYFGAEEGVAAIIASEGCFEVGFITETTGEGWIVSGLLDEMERHVQSTKKTKVKVHNQDAELGEMLEAHHGVIAKADPAPLPGDPEEGLTLFVRFLGAAYGE